MFGIKCSTIEQKTIIYKTKIVGIVMDGKFSPHGFGWTCKNRESHVVKKNVTYNC